MDPLFGEAKKRSKDVHILYEASVQTPKKDIQFIEKVFRDHQGRKPLLLREDFCGTALLCAEWVKRGPEYQAIGVDLDKPTLEWGRENHIKARSVDNQVELFHANVLEDVTERRADVTASLNFSLCIFHDRPTLVQYCRIAYDNLCDDGVFISDLYGGATAFKPEHITKELPGFTYHWDCDKYDPITNVSHFTISFEFPDKSVIRNAFDYHFRLWSIQEIREVFKSTQEVGFDEVRVWFATIEDGAFGSSEFKETKQAEQTKSWLAYVVGFKKTRK